MLPRTGDAQECAIDLLQEYSLRVDGAQTAVFDLNSGSAATATAQRQKPPRNLEIVELLSLARFGGSATRLRKILSDALNAFATSTAGQCKLTASWTGSMGMSTRLGTRLTRQFEKLVFARYCALRMNGAESVFCTVPARIRHFQQSVTQNFIN